MDILKEIKVTYKASITSPHPDETYIETLPGDFKKVCMLLHKSLRSPAMMFFASDDRQAEKHFTLYCVFMDTASRKWFFVSRPVSPETPSFDSLSKEMYSASLFEREIHEMFGIEPKGNPDMRRLHLHDEVWPAGYYPLRKDFKAPAALTAAGQYCFKRIEGEGVFEVPVGPVHAGVIGPGHFRFSAAGEPIINLEARLGFTHRGIEKLFEGKAAADAVKLAECVSGDSSVSHALSFCHAVEKAFGVTVPERASLIRAICLELERMYNHANDIGGIAVDVGFSFPSAYASLMKEDILALNEKLSGSRYLKGSVVPGGMSIDLTAEKISLIKECLGSLRHDLKELKNMLLSSVSFMDRVDTTGTLPRKAAEDLGIVGLAGRASGIHWDLRRDFPGVYSKVKFIMAKQEQGDVLARLRIRFDEFAESLSLISMFLDILSDGEVKTTLQDKPVNAFALGYSEGWRGPVLYWLKFDSNGVIERCKIVDPSFHNWQGLCFAAPGNIIPDFPLCNKSFDLSYSGNDL